MYRKIIILATACFFCGVITYAQKTIINDPNAEKRDVKAFSSIGISSGIDLYLSQGDEDGIAVSASEIKYRNHIKTNVVDGNLTIRVDENIWDHRSGNKKRVAYVSFKSLTAIYASGASDIYINGTLKGEKLRIQLSGASDLRGEVEVTKLSISQMGASDANISGKSESLRIIASGASKFKGYNFEADNCNVKATEASEIEVTVNTELNASASGASYVYYKGDGVAKVSKSNGASKIRKN